MLSRVLSDAETRMLWLALYASEFTSGHNSGVSGVEAAQRATRGVAVLSALVLSDASVGALPSFLRPPEDDSSDQGGRSGQGSQ